MKELANIFQPEFSPIHKMDYSIASQLVLSGGDLVKEVIPAGTLLKSSKGGPIELNPVDGVVIATAAEEGIAVLAHDVTPEAGVTDYSVGVMIKGVVYQDVMEQANTPAVFTSDVIKALAPNILTYNVKTLKK